MRINIILLAHWAYIAKYSVCAIQRAGAICTDNQMWNARGMLCSMVCLSHMHLIVNLRWYYTWTRLKHDQVKKHTWPPVA